jgi:NAD(P) transhydrogenase subunit alpha
MTGQALLGIYVFVLACFAGYQLITKVPPTLHTPLMSGANAISGVTILGALVVARVVGVTDTIDPHDANPFGIATYIGVAAVALATINVVGGYLVTDRMLKMFSGKKKG